MTKLLPRFIFWLIFDSDSKVNISPGLSNYRLAFLRIRQFCCELPSVELFAGEPFIGYLTLDEAYKRLPTAAADLTKFTIIEINFS